MNKKTVTFHIPTELLELMDAKSQQLGLSRNAYVIQTMNSLLRFEQAILDRIDADQFKEIIHSAIKAQNK